MILCSSCHHKEITGALFCSECGAQLVFAEDDPLAKTTTYASATYNVKPVEQTAPPTYPATDGDAIISLNILATGEILPLAGRTEITLGRVSGGQPIIPDVDLTPYQAYEAGVSRLHASVKISSNQVSITDLGSANGTRVNGKKISPQSPFLLRHGDVLTLGKFKVQVLIRNE